MGTTPRSTHVCRARYLPARRVRLGGRVEGGVGGYAGRRLVPCRQRRERGRAARRVRRLALQDPCRALQVHALPGGHPPSSCQPSLVDLSLGTTTACGKRAGVAVAVGWKDACPSSMGTKLAQLSTPRRTGPGTPRPPGSACAPRHGTATPSSEAQASRFGGVSGGKMMGNSEQLRTAEG